MDKIDLRTVGLFLDWTKRKIGLHMAERKVYFYEREIWWASLGENIGSEENGKHALFERPVIILKSTSKDIIFVIPVSTVLRTGNWYHRFDLHGQPRLALLVQARCLSTKRLIRKMGTIDAATFQDIQRAFISFITNGSPGFSEDPRSR